MKRKYIKPEIIIVEMEMESLLGSESGGQIYEGHAKNHSFSFSDDDESDSSIPQSDNVWDD